MEEKQIKKIYKKLQKIQDKIDENGAFFMFIMGTDGKVKLGSMEHTEKECKKAFKERIKGKDEYIGNAVYLVEFFINDKYVEHPNKLIGGPFSYKIIQYHLSKKYNIKYLSGNINGAVWYTNEDLAEGKFHQRDLKKIIQVINDRRINILSIGKIRAVKLLEKLRSDD